tara:strand:+ start:344 stop:472 length:129 start_codon:yes stop_codon:yes gene_type:complete
MYEWDVLGAVPRDPTIEELLEERETVPENDRLITMPTYLNKL